MSVMVKMRYGVGIEPAYYAKKVGRSKLLSALQQNLGSINDVTDEQVQEAVNQFLTQNPIAPTLTDDGVLIL